MSHVPQLRSAQSILNEIALRPQHAPDQDDADFITDPTDPAMDAEVEAEFAQEEKWQSLADSMKFSEADMKHTAREYGITTPADAIELAFAGAGKGFPKRGSWNATSVWLFLTLRDAGVIDNNGETRYVAEADKYLESASK